MAAFSYGTLVDIQLLIIVIKLQCIAVTRLNPAAKSHRITVTSCIFFKKTIKIKIVIERPSETRLRAQVSYGGVAFHRSRKYFAGTVEKTVKSTIFTDTSEKPQNVSK